jgi:Cu+-exporting ATPase
MAVTLPGIFPRTFAMDTQTSTPKNFQLVHQLSRRIRILSPVLKNDQERGYIFEILLKKTA